jgi:YVTN family beta-propeller protein
MRMNQRFRVRLVLLITLTVALTAVSTRLRADTGTCGGVMTTLPFTDVMGNGFFCQIAAAYFSGLTNGTDATHYSPANIVTREQMAAFITRTMDQALRRGSQRARLDQFWNTQTANNLGLTGVGQDPHFVKSDGVHLWVANKTSSTVSQVRASDGALLDTWTGATNAFDVLCAMGKVYVTGDTSPGRLYEIDPTQPAGMVGLVSGGLGNQPEGIAYDGQRIWTVNATSVSIITLNPTVVTNVTTGFTSPQGITYDGANIWVTDDIAGSVDKLHKLNSSGGIVQSVDIGSNPLFPAFDGTNIWVPNRSSNTVSVVRASTAAVIATLSGNGLNGPNQAAFDGERILVTNHDGDNVSLWKAADLTPMGMFSTGTNTYPYGVCSDGLSFWVTLRITEKLARF